MPARNVIKTYTEDSYYHVYNRGVSKQNIFLDEKDFVVFLSLFKRYLSSEPQLQPNGQKYLSFRGDVTLMAYCLMPNHYHLLLHQNSRDGMQHFLKSLGVAYSMYFNKRYDHVGVVFQQRYRAARMTSDVQFVHASRYIHMNPDDYYEWQWSSLRYYLGDKPPEWLSLGRVPDVADYRRFLDEYKSRREELKRLGDILAG